MTDEKLSRRQLLQTAIAGLAAVPAAGLFVSPAGAETLSESDATAKSLGYVADAKKVDPKANPNYKPGQTCGNCMQYTGKAGCRRRPLQHLPRQGRRRRGLVQGLGAEAGRHPGLNPARRPPVEDGRRASARAESRAISYDRGPGPSLRTRGP